MNPIETFWDILKHEIHSETINKPLTTKRVLMERLIKVLIYSEKITWFCSTHIESMPDRIKALKASKRGKNDYWTTSACDENVSKVALLVS